jgi:hypothetical protein
VAATGEYTQILGGTVEMAMAGIAAICRESFHFSKCG